MFKSFEIVPKIEVTAQNLGMIYTPGVAAASEKISQDIDNSWVLTNRINSVAVISQDYEKSLKRAIFLKDTLQIDAYPFALSDKKEIKFVVENIAPSFKAIDLSQIKELEEIDFGIEIPVLTSQKVDLKDFFGTISRTLFMKKTEDFSGDIKEVNCSHKHFFESCSLGNCDVNRSCKCSNLSCNLSVTFLERCQSSIIRNLNYVRC